VTSQTLKPICLSGSRNNTPSHFISCSWLRPLIFTRAFHVCLQSLLNHESWKQISRMRMQYWTNALAHSSVNKLIVLISLCACISWHDDSSYFASGFGLLLQGIAARIFVFAIGLEWNVSNCIAWTTICGVKEEREVSTRSRIQIFVSQNMHAP
jgi:hypothetical protein